MSPPTAHPRLPLLATLLLLAIVALALLSLLTGAGYVDMGESLAFLLGDAGARTDARVRTAVWVLRMPRTLAAIVVGAALGVAGCLLQTLTRNPLAESGLLGINAGAALAVVIGISFAGASAGVVYLLWAFGGALVGTLCVLALANAPRGAVTPLRLVLAGVALGATFHGFTALILLGHHMSLDQFRFWVLGSLSGIALPQVLQILPVVLASLGLALLLARPLSALLLSDGMARALGHSPGRVRFGVTVTVALAAGAAVALAGPIAFLGLLAPHVARAMAGARLGMQLLLSALVGMAMLLAADVVARIVIRPFEAPASVIVALAGAPLLIWIVRSNRLLNITSSRIG